MYHGVSKVVDIHKSLNGGILRFRLDPILCQIDHFIPSDGIAGFDFRAVLDDVPVVRISAVVICVEVFVGEFL